MHGTGLRPSSRARRWAPFAVVIALGIAVQGWATLQWRANFDSDEAIFGLMARHILYRGDVPVYCYGQNYMGSLDSILAALSMRLLGPTVLALRLPQLALFAAWMALHGFLVARWWGRRVALLSLLILAFLGWRMLQWTYRPNISPNLVLGLGTAALLLSVAAPPPRRAWHRYLRAGLLGAVTGLALWVNPLGIVFPFTIALLSWLRAPQWTQAWASIRERWGRAGLAVLSVGLLPVMALLGVLGFFSAACEPRVLFTALQTTGVVILAVLALAIGLSMWRVLLRRGPVTLKAGAFLLGFLSGNLPQWLAWLVRGIRPSAALSPSCPSGIPERARLVFGTLLPGLWGLPPLERIPKAAPDRAVLWGLLLALIAAAILSFAWRGRRALWALLTASPLAPEHVPTNAVALLFSVPVALAVLGSNTVDVLSIRYLLVAWQASSVVLALLLARLPRRSSWLGMLALALWFAAAGIRNPLQLRRVWAQQRFPFVPQATAALEQHLAGHGAQGGYANYWTAYALDFLLEERVVLTPYNHDRYPPYTAAVEQLPVQAYIFRRGTLAGPSAEMSDLIQAVQADQVAGPGFPWIVERLSQQTLLGCESVANWDVCLVANRPP